MTRKLWFAGSEDKLRRFVVFEGVPSCFEGAPLLPPLIR
jgi:hypothetical protein